jgi:chromosome segregation ATPase
LVVLASVTVLFWGTKKPISTVPTIKVPSKDLRSFVDSYEEKMRIRSELKSLESRLRKGKIPRRRFKVRKKMLESRLSTVSRNLFSLRENIKAAGSRYANMMRQIEVAETNLESAEMDIQRVKNRYKRGEVSKGAYRKLMEEYDGRIEEAETSIDGTLLRLRE